MESGDPCSPCPQSARSRNTEQLSAPAIVHHRVLARQTTYLSESTRGEVCLLKERNGNLAGNDAEVGSVGNLKQLIEDALFLRREV